MTTHKKPAAMQVQANLAQLGILGRLTLLALIAKFAPTSTQYANSSDYKNAADKLIAHGATLKTSHDNAETAKKAAATAINARDVEVLSFDGDFNVFRALAETLFKTEADFHDNGLNRRVKNAQADLNPPVKITARPGSSAKGEIFVHALRLVGLTRYICAISVDPVTPTSWEVQNGAQARRTITGLVSGKGYWIKFCTERGANRSVWSEPVYCVAS